VRSFGSRWPLGDREQYRPGGDLHPQKVDTDAQAAKDGEAPPLVVAHRHTRSNLDSLERTVLILLLSLAASGLIIGALGRLVVPGPNPMSLLATMGVGLGGAIIGGLVGHLVIGWRYRYSYGFGFILAVLGAALIVVLIERSRRTR
jgi:uncharacterized membrane protein YeaQ/YmgE (transglycosylase-associated protein family)